MMPDQAPKCICGTKQWNSGGASISPLLQSQWFTCNNCSRPALNISNGGGHAFIIPTESNGEFPEDGMEWVNGTLLITLRDVQERLTKARDVIEEAACKDFCESEGLPHESKMHDMDEGQRTRFQSMFDALHKEESWRSPAGFEEQSLPPQIPRSVTVYHPLGGCEWKEINHAETADIEIPADPVRVRHDAYFGEVFANLEEEFGEISRTEVKNEYCGAESEPWFRFVLGSLTFTVGPRKRVIAVKVDASEGFDTESIRSVASADDTAYTADGGWKSDAETATSIEVHAWTKEKLIEYLMILGRAGKVTAAQTKIFAVSRNKAPTQGIVSGIFLSKYAGMRF